MVEQNECLVDKNKYLVDAKSCFAEHLLKPIVFVDQKGAILRCINGSKNKSVLDPNLISVSIPDNMKSKIKFGFSTLLTMAISMNFAFAQQSNTPEKPITNNTSAEYQTLKKDWDNFQTKVEAKKVKSEQKPVLETEYNGLIERVEDLCEGIKPATPGKTPVKVLSSATAPADKPKKEQGAALK